MDDTDKPLQVVDEHGNKRFLFPVAKVKVQTKGGNPGIAWYAVPINPFDSLPLMADGEILYAGGWCPERVEA
jgi:hypothetical protein